MRENRGSGERWRQRGSLEGIAEMIHDDTGSRCRSGNVQRLTKSRFIQHGKHLGEVIKKVRVPSATVRDTDFSIS